MFVFLSLHTHIQGVGISCRIPREMPKHFRDKYI